MMRHDYTLAVSPQHIYDEIDSCAQEIAAYLSDHENWPQPILPKDGDCEEMEFVPDHFDLFATNWNCLNQPKQNSGKEYFKCCIDSKWSSISSSVMKCWDVEGNLHYFRCFLPF